MTRSRWCSGQRRDGWWCCTYPPTVPGSTLLKCVFRQFRREVTHNELFQTVKCLLTAAREFFDRYNQEPCRILSVIGSTSLFPIR
jgi:hypothetical protein